LRELVGGASLALRYVICFSAPDIQITTREAPPDLTAVADAGGVLE
jgi:hypothetical protein